MFDSGIAIGSQRITERVFERAEPWREILPLIDAFTIQGLANLLGTCGANAALRLVKLNALGFEFEATELEQAPYIAFQVVHDILMVDAQYAAGQHPIPVSHQFEISPVVARDVFDAVSELLALGKQLLEVAETAGHRFSPRVDDLRVR